MTGIIYIRVSSDDQVKGTSLDEQLEACQRYCEENSIQVLGVFREEGASAKSTEREKFLEAIEFCRKNKVDAFIVWKGDRFARNLLDHYAVKSTLIKYGTKLHSVTEKFTDDPTGKLLEGMMAVIAEFDNDVRRQRCSGGMLGRLKKGIYPWHPPIGYLCEQNKKHDRKKEAPDPIDPVKFPILKRALKELVDTPHTPTHLANLLKQYGFTASTKGGKIDERFASRILTKHLRFYAGILDNPFYPAIGEASYKGAHQAMITDDEMLAIQKMRQLKMKQGESVPMKFVKYNENFPLKGTLYCSLCRHKLTGSTSHGNGGLYAYYNCFTTGCSRKGKALAKKDLEARFLAYIKHITPKKEFLELFRNRVIEAWNEQGRKFDVDIKQYQASISNLQERKAKVRAVRSQSECTDEQYADRMAEIGNKELVTSISLNEAKIERFDIEMVVIYATSFISNLPRTWFDLPRVMRPQFQKLVFPEGVLVDADKKLRTTKLGYIYELNKQLNHDQIDEGTFVDPSGFEPLTSALQMRRSTN